MKKNTIDDIQIDTQSGKLLWEEENNCAMTKAMKVIGGKWKLLLLNAIRKECPMRFGELRKKMKDITHATLTLQLRELERDGIIERKVYAETPPRVEYKLTPIGIQLVPTIQALCDWGDAYYAIKGSQNC
ncbi:winged helix-turn-helix transcriptional regulator [Chitinophaga qingshengii]|uniref:Helix-turn-helix transcriptional regulator n=1 Tax=Chitinophaga qingshengii TaxID=1569794 RepID=A0ABR7THK6_9BACT|nr:helix-turn-helix domain-containing protein [Chitinophaga qingshengii]MBC9929433.1 helix-turn-helix transcriptional regulator [Chitinophaga qingshengii]